MSETQRAVARMTRAMSSPRSGIAKDEGRPRRGTDCEYISPSPEESRSGAVNQRKMASQPEGELLRDAGGRATEGMYTQPSLPDPIHPPGLMQQPFIPEFVDPLDLPEDFLTGQTSWSESATANNWLPAQSTIDVDSSSDRPCNVESTTLDYPTADGQVVADALIDPSAQASFFVLQSGNPCARVSEDVPSRQALHCKSYLPLTITANLRGQHDIPTHGKSVFVRSLPPTDQSSRPRADHAPISKLDGTDAFSPWIRRIFDRQEFLQKHSVWQGKEGDIQNDFRTPSTYSPHQHFGNLPFSSAIDSNHYPLEIQEMQRHSLFAPPWDALPLSDSEALEDPLAGIFRECRADIENGANVDEICGAHPYVAALDDPAVYEKAPKLSQMMARLVTSVKPDRDSTSFTMFALMSTHWALFRWMLKPSQKQYADIPEIVRPSPWQLFKRHWLVVDFVHSPEMRQHFCSTQYLDMQWMANACSTITCD
ncbi:hc-toxin efflux carrier toxa [Teratosphaeria destructans]|uniref:Hc-toxin efflux carrier toxa n=1 Tax=Teratosphaeria destructans TaxID=418781 RepID=A0A9W7SKS1_9PEZI|nr:hc-toxin efflux carrier toxa [Teratosphaeria destructans]